MRTTPFKIMIKSSWKTPISKVFERVGSPSSFFSQTPRKDMAVKVVHLAASVGAGGAAVGLLNLHKGLCQIGLRLFNPRRKGSDYGH